MNDRYETSINRSLSDFSDVENINSDDVNLSGINNDGIESKIILIESQQLIKNAPEQPKVNGHKDTSKISASICSGDQKFSGTSDIFRLCVKNGEYVYAKPNDIIMIESCDHLVRVYLGVDDRVKLTTRHDTLKDFLLQLPPSQFMRIGRFCAINTHRLSGGNCNKQVFEFDFKISIELKHAVSHAVFSTIGK